MFFNFFEYPFKNFLTIDQEIAKNTKYSKNGIIGDTSVNEGVTHIFNNTPNKQMKNSI